MISLIDNNILSNTSLIYPKNMIDTIEKIINTITNIQISHENVVLKTLSAMVVLKDDTPIYNFNMAINVDDISKYFIKLEKISNSSIIIQLFNKNNCILKMNYSDINMKILKEVLYILL